MSLLDLLFPKYCLECRKVGSYICTECRVKCASATLICPVCKLFSPTGATHKSCVSKYCLDGLVTIWRYEGVVRKAILGLKYRFASDIADELVGICLWRIKKIKLPNDLILVPIPLHTKRLNWRGFNQAQVLGTKIAKEMGWDCGNFLVRNLNKIPQAQLGKAERLRNIRGVFAVNYEAKDKIKDKNIMIFDDVYTTGSTLSEATKVLKKARAKEVWGMAIAR